MKATELRIGNWWTNGKENYVVDASTIYDMETAQKDGQYDLYKPVPLTQEWLFKLGAQEKYSGIFVFKTNKRSVIQLHKFITMDSYKCAQTRLKMNYVHELQNLYFALTGEELETNQ